MVLHDHPGIAGILRQFQEVRFQSENPDFLEHYVSNFERRASGTLMPPSPGIKSYRFSALYDPMRNDSVYTFEPVFREGVWSALKYLPRFQLEHRSRVVAYALQPLAANQLRSRLEKFRDASDWMDEVKLSDEQSAAALDIVIDETLSRVTVEWDTLLRYIKDHETSSLGGSLKWADMLDTSASDWLPVLEELKGFLEKLRSAGHRGDKFGRPFFTGLRARSSGISSKFAGPGTVVKRRVDQTRVVMFFAAFSIWTAFIPNHREWYSAILTRFADEILGLTDEVSFPYVEGGEVYVKASDYNKDYHFSPYDGKNWESFVPLLGEAFNPFWTWMNGISALPSGESVTSVLGTMATMVAHKVLIVPHYPGERKVIFAGDDLSLWHDRPKDPRLDIGKIVEFQPDDQKAKFMLGVGYHPDPYLPRVYGLKMTTDRADKSIPIRFGDDGVIRENVVGKADERITDTWLGLYHGQFAGESLVSRLRTIPGEEWRGPGAMIQSMAADEKLLFGSNDETLENDE